MQALHLLHEGLLEPWNKWMKCIKNQECQVSSLRYARLRSINTHQTSHSSNFLRKLLALEALFFLFRLLTGPR